MDSVILQQHTPTPQWLKMTKAFLFLVALQVHHRLVRILCVIHFSLHDPRCLEQAEQAVPGTMPAVLME